MFCVRCGYDIVDFVSGEDMTAAPELSETFTYSRVESSLTRPETREREGVDSQERFFMKSDSVQTERSTG